MDFGRQLQQIAENREFPGADYMPGKLPGKTTQRITSVRCIPCIPCILCILCFGVQFFVFLVFLVFRHVVRVAILCFL